jgi:hypothetical protein
MIVINEIVAEKLERIEKLADIGHVSRDQVVRQAVMTGLDQMERELRRLHRRKTSPKKTSANRSKRRASRPPPEKGRF